MALNKSFTLSGKSYVNTDAGKISTGSADVNMNCYIKIESAGGDKDSVSIVVSFTDGDKTFQKGYSFAPNMDGDNFIKQGYLYLKTLDEFSGATDV